MERHTSARDETQPSVAATPWWFEQVLIVVCATVIAWGGASVFLAYRAEYTFPRAAALGSLGTLIAIAAVVVRERPRPRVAGSSAAALFVIAGTAVLTIWNCIYAGHHVASDNDPGVYLLAGKWISAHGSLVIPAGQGWPSGIRQIGTQSPGVYPIPHGLAQFQFAHFLPALLAEGHGFGGDGLMFRVNALVGALALLVIFAVGCRLCRRPWIVAAAVLGLGASIPEINCVRDAFSEPSTQLVLWSGIWLLMIAAEHRRGWRHLPVALLGGAALGATVMTRIDGVAYLIFVPLVAAFGWLARRGADRRNLVITYGAVVAGAVPAIALGTLDVQRRAGFYYRDLHHNVFALYKACAVMFVVAALLLVVWPRAGAVRSWLVERRSQIGTAAGVAAVLAGVFAWSVRPAIQKLRWPSVPTPRGIIALNTSLQRQEGLTLDGLRTYGERSVVWLSWYLGPVAVVLAIAGLGVVVARAVRRPTSATVIPLFIAGSLAAEYLWNDHVNGHQPWAMRRFLPAVLPLCMLLAVVGIAIVTDLLERVVPASRVRIAAGLAAIALVAFPVGRTLPVGALHTGANIPGAIRKVCTTVGPNAAIVSTGIVGILYTQTFRDWCNVPAVRAQLPLDAATVHELAQVWKAKGRTLWLLGVSAAAVQPPIATPRLIASATSDREVEITLSRPPEKYATKTLTIWGAPVP